jgi:RNA polymerase sigma factor (sigma-70 family)
VEEFERLVLRAQAGDMHAYGEIVGRFQGMVYGYAYSMLGDTHLAEDAAQDAFVEAYRGLAKLATARAFPAWLRRIVSRCCGRRSGSNRLATVSLDKADEVASDEPGPSQLAERREAEGIAHAAIRSLPEPARTATVLFYINGYSQSDIAEFLEVPVNTVKTRLHGARKRLRERMLTMVAEELQAAKPESDFAARVRRIILLRRSGKDDDALRFQESLLGALRRMQREGRYAEAVEEHRAVMATIKAEAKDPRMWCQTYGLLAKSYIKSGKAGELVLSLREIIPPEPAPQEVALWAGEAMCDLVTALHESGRDQEAISEGERLIEMLRSVVSGLSLEPWSGPSVPATAPPFAKVGEMFRNGQIGEYFLEAEGLLRQRRFGEFRKHVAAVVLLPEAILAGTPTEIAPAEVPSVLRRMHHATLLLLKQKRYDLCLRAVRDSLSLAERLQGHPSYRFHRVHAMLDQLSVAVERPDEDGKAQLRDALYSELALGEEELRAACPGIRTLEQVTNDDQRYWCQRLADAYTVVADWLHHLGTIGSAEGLRLARRAAELTVDGIVEEHLARWTLSVENDRRAALTHLKRAVALQKDFVEHVFSHCAEYAPVREDPEFLAAVRG